MVRIPDSHSGGPGSIPGCGTFYKIQQNNQNNELAPSFLPLPSLWWKFIVLIRIVEILNKIIYDQKTFFVICHKSNIFDDAYKD